MNKTQRLQQHVTAYIADNFNQKPYEWLTSNRFVDHHGCDGYIFKNERAARRYVLGDIHEKGFECESACSDDDWINILQGIGMSKRYARETVEKGRWEKVARRMLDAYGPSYFLSTYSGQVAILDDDDCSLLYY